MKISTFESQRDNEPASGEATWQELVDGFTNVRITSCTTENCQRSNCVHKAGPAWSPAYWEEGVTRGSAVKGVSALVIDIDHITQDTLDAIISEMAYYQCVIHSSHSDSPEDRCIRIVVEISRPIMKEEWTRFWTGAITLLDLPADKQARDAGRLYYLPSRPTGAVYLYESFQGDLIDVDEVLAKIPQTTTAASSPQATYIPPVVAPTSSIDKLCAAAQILASVWPTELTKGRHQAHLSLAGALARAGWDAEDIGNFLYTVAELAEEGVGKLNVRLNIARASIDKIESGKAVTGWPRLSELIDPDAVKKARVLLGLGIEHDAEFVNGMADIAIVGAFKDLSTRPTKGMQTTAMVLKKVINGELITDPKELGLTIKTMITHAPPGTSDQQLVNLLRGSAPGQSDRLVGMFAAGRIHLAAEAAAQEIGDDDSAEPADDEEIRMRLKPDPGGDGVRVCGTNIAMILKYSEELRGRLRFNVLTKIIKVTEGRFKDEIGTLGVTLTNWLEDEWALFATTLKVEEQLQHVSRKFGSYDPVADYLNSLTWDGVPRLDGMLHNYCGVSPYEGIHVKWFSSKFMISAVARAMKPGCKVDTVLILEGNQGIGKSTALGILGGEWFSDTPMVLGDKDSRMLAASKWIIELAELSSLNNREVETHKAFLSSCQDDFRLPYSRVTESFPRRCVFAGSTNDNMYLRDSTGARRFWPVRAGIVSAEELKRDRNQLWAEAVHRFKALEQWWLTPEEQLVVDEVTASRRVEDPWTSLIINWSSRLTVGNAPPKEEWTLAEIANGAIGISAVDLPKNSKHLAVALREAGFDQFTTRVGGAKRTFWKRREGVAVPTPTNADGRPLTTN